YRWRSLPRVRRHRASKPQGSSERVLPWQVTMDQLICASLSHTHYWYEVGMLKVLCIAGGIDRLSTDFSVFFRSTALFWHKTGHCSSNFCFLTTMKIHNLVESYMCVVLCFLPIHSGHQVRWTYQPGSHRRKVTQDFSSTFLLRCV
ncbi:unnamed protein product, partial [Ascophyllum nodosum]